MLLYVLPGYMVAQRGPGGVSTETTSPQQSTCRLWLDASKLTNLADGDNINAWTDASQSNQTESAIPGISSSPPYFRDDPAYSINSHPVATFGDDRFFLLGIGGDGESSPDLNLAEITKTKTVFFAFRTGTDVQSLQCIYQEGGRWRGFNTFINDGKVKVGAYDWSANPGDASEGNTDGDGTPPWGFSYVEHPVQPNTTYVLTAQFSAPQTGTVQANGDYFIRAFLNGEDFSGMQYATDFVSYQEDGVGTLHNHNNPIGLGSVNEQWVTPENGAEDNVTGEYAFQGLFAELCYYNDLLTPTQRIIIENYLGAKYFANIITNDKFDFQTEYGNGVIGIGKATTNTQESVSLDLRDAAHNESKGDTPFTISKVGNNYSGANLFYLMGHNNQSLSFTEEDVPNDPSNTRRLRRTWRADETGDMGAIEYTIDEADLPPLPSGFTQYVLMVDETSQNFPNFNLGSTRVLGLQDNGDGTHTIEYDMPDSAFFTIGAIRPEVRFENTVAYALEEDTPPDSTQYTQEIKVKLNYEPAFAPSISFDYNFFDASATRADDYGYDNVVQSSGGTIVTSQSETTLPIWIKNDDTEEDLDSLFVVLNDGPNTSSGIFIGEPDSLVFYVYDDDPPPRVNFPSPSITAAESAGDATITLQRTGEQDGTATVRVKTTGGTATSGQDFNYSSGWHQYSFTDGQSQLTFPVDLINDETDEYPETIDFIVQGVTNIATDTTADVLTLTINDDDPLPNASFLSATGEGFEATGEPYLFIALDRQSSKPVDVHYSVDGSSTAQTTDYTISNPGTVSFSPMDTLKYPSTLTVNNTDESPEPDETLVLTLDSAQNAVVNAPLSKTYTIRDFTAYNWLGAAGIGRAEDNIVWMDASRETGSQGDHPSSLSNFSPRNIGISQSASNKRGELQTTGSYLINNRQTIRLDGNNDYYQIEDDGLINLADYSGRKSFFMVVKTGNDVSSRQVLFEEGGGWRGLSIYLEEDTLYFHAWNPKNDGPESPWGWGEGESDPAERRFAYYPGLSANTSYIISCHFNKDANEPLTIYVNGEKGVPETQDCGRLYTHGADVGIGGIANQCLFLTDHEDPQSGSEFGGLFAELILFQEPLMNEARRIILANYLSGKYNIPLDGNNTPQVFDLNYGEKSVNTYFGYDIAGIGQENSNDVHLVSQGPPSRTQLRVQGTSGLSASSYMVWGHNGEALENTWPYSSSSLPAQIVERSGRVWKFFEQGNVGPVNIRLDFSQLQNADTFIENDIKLLVNTSSNPQDFSSASIYNANTPFNSGQIAQFDQVDIPNGAYITLANTNSTTPLPIELLSFNARLNSINSTVDLNWATATETHNDYFVVERAGKDLRFKKVLEKPGAGSTTHAQYYSAVDGQPLTGINYYRLKQVDYDGDATYSDVKSVYVPGGTVSDDAFLYPNPYQSGELNIRYPNSGGEKTIRILDMSGKVIYNRSFNSDSNLIKMDPGDLTPGVYIVSFCNPHIEATNKLIVK